MKYIVIDVTGTQPKGLGSVEFSDLPRSGELVEIERDGIAYCYDVAQVIHSAKGCGCDIYVAHPRLTAEARREIETKA